MSERFKSFAESRGIAVGRSESISEGISQSNLESEGISDSYTYTFSTCGCSLTATRPFVWLQKSKTGIDLWDFRQKLRRAARQLTVAEFVELRQRCDELFDEILRGKGRRRL
jgi:hypothetical protein